MDIKFIDEQLKKLETILKKLKDDKEKIPVDRESYYQKIIEETEHQIAQLNERRKETKSY